MVATIKPQVCKVLRAAQHRSGAFALEDVPVEHDLQHPRRCDVQVLLTNGALTIAAILAAAGGLLLVWPNTDRFKRVTGTLLLVAAALFCVPVPHLAGAFVGAFALFLAATTLISRRRYAAAVPVAAALFALIPVTLSV
jgi:hypothetical protein